jgi:hypothetical protein
MQSLTANPTRLVALIAGVAVLAGGLFVFKMTGGGSSSAASSSPTLLHTSVLHKHAPSVHGRSTPTHVTRKAPQHARPAVHRTAVAPSGLPWSVQDALAHNPVVVVAVVSPKVPIDALSLAEAKAGAKSEKAAFVEVNAYSQKQIGPFASVITLSSNPTILVMRAPKDVTLQVPSYVDRQSIMQAIDDARITKPAPADAR